MATNPIVPPSATETDDGPQGLCLLLGASFFGLCRHARCRALNAALAEAREVRDDDGRSPR